MNETIRVKGLTDDEGRTVNRLLAELDAKSLRNRIRKAYYDMKVAPKLVGSVIPPQYWRAGIVLGWSGKAVDLLARRCNVDDFVWPNGDLGSIGFNEWWERNRLGSEIRQAFISSLIHSVAFGINTTGTADNPNSYLHFKTALDATGDWNSFTRRMDNLLSVLEYSSDEHEPNRPIKLALYLDGETVTMARDGGAWSVTDRTKHVYGVPVEPLVYKPRIGRPFGSSRISRAVMSHQDAAVRSAIRLEAHGDIYAIPDLWMLGADESIFKNSDGSQKESWQVVMGRIKGIPDDENAAEPRADVKQIPASSPKPHLDMIRQQAQLFSGETSIPLTSLGVADNNDATSAESYIASREDLIAEAEGAADDWRPSLRRLAVRGLAMANNIGLDSVPGEWLSIDTKFRSPIYQSRAAQADAGMKQITAAPWLAETEVGLELLGLTDQQIERALSERRRAGGSQVLEALRRSAEAVSGGDTDAAEE